MKEWALKYLTCPACAGFLAWTEFERDATHLMEGALLCAGCAAWYPLTRGVPRLLPRHLREELTDEFAKKFRSRLQAMGVALTADSGSHEETLGRVKAHTQQNFGFEWTEYARHGWDDPDYNISSEEAVFGHKSLMQPHEFQSLLVLDAGCGNGRYAYWATQYGGRVIGVDLTHAVDAAFQNTRESESIAIVQADLFCLPFPQGVFDIAYSIGVLMHTGDARGAFESVSRHVRVGGSLTAHLYGKGNAIYEWVDRRLRAWSTRLSIPELMSLTGRLYRVARISDRLGMRGLLTCFVRIDEHPHCIFDWYAAPVATHHTYQEVEEWFAQAGFRVADTQRPFTSANPIKAAAMRVLGYPWPVTVRGIRNS